MATVDRAAYRIVQEALTNVTRYAGIRALLTLPGLYCAWLAICSISLTDSAWSRAS